MLGFFLVIIPYQNILFIFKIYNIVSFLFLLLIFFFDEYKKKLFNSKQNYIFFISLFIIFLPLLFFNINNEEKLILSLLKIINIFILSFLILYIFLSNLISYFIKGFIFATTISALFAINQYYGVEFFYNVRFFFNTDSAWGDGYFILRPPGLAYTSIQLSVTLLISICLIFYLNAKNNLEKRSFEIIFIILLITPFLITAKILVIINFFVLFSYFLIKKKSVYSKYFVNFIIVFYLFFLSLFIIINLNQYSRGFIEKLGLISINFQEKIYQVESKILGSNQKNNDYLKFKKYCKLKGFYKDSKINCENLSYKEYLVVKKNVSEENLIPVFLNYGSHNSNINSFVFGGVFYFITTVLFKLSLFYKTLNEYFRTRKLDYLISFSFLSYLEIYTNFHNSGLSTLSVLYIPFYFLIFLQILYRKDLSN